MSAIAHWFKDQPVRHVGTLELGQVAAVDFEESLVGVAVDEADRLVWWRMENVIEVRS